MQSAVYCFGFYLESAPTLPGSTVDLRRGLDISVSGPDSAGGYSPEHAHLHQSYTQIAWCELLAVVACASTYAPLLQVVHAFLRRQSDGRAHHQPARNAQQGTRWSAPSAVQHRLPAQHLHSRRAPPRGGQCRYAPDFLSRPALHRNDHVARWAAADPFASAHLSSVSLVSSKHYVSSSTSSPATPSVVTPASPTSQGNASSAPSAP